MIDFMWSVLSNCLPTKHALHARHVELDTAICPMFQQAEENVWHLLIECPVAKEVWRVGGFGVQGEGLYDCKDWLVRLNNLLSREQLGKIVAISWSLWQARNNLVWHRKQFTARHIIQTGLGLLEAWLNAQDLRGGGSVFVQQSYAVTWRKPETGWIKVNTDAAVFQDCRLRCCKCGFRDATGRFVGAITQQVKHITEAQMLEVMAIRDVLSWLKARSRSKVVVESDCLLAVQAINSSVELLSSFGLVVSDCKLLLTTLQDVRVVFVKRSANVAAHLLAWEAHSSPGLFVWGSSPSDSIVSVLLDEM